MPLPSHLPPLLRGHNLLIILPEQTILSQRIFWYLLLITTYYITYHPIPLYSSDFPSQVHTISNLAKAHRFIYLEVSIYVCYYPFLLFFSFVTLLSFSFFDLFFFWILLPNMFLQVNVWSISSRISQSNHSQTITSWHQQCFSVAVPYEFIKVLSTSPRQCPSLVNRWCDKVSRCPLDVQNISVFVSFFFFFCCFSFLSFNPFLFL